MTEVLVVEAILVGTVVEATVEVPPQFATIEATVTRPSHESKRRSFTRPIVSIGPAGIPSSLGTRFPPKGYPYRPKTRFRSSCQLVFVDPPSKPVVSMYMPQGG